MIAITKFLRVPLFFLVLASSVQAEIYETVDDEGNPVFSDKPSPGAKEVELPAENIADAPPPSKRPTEAVPQARPKQDSEQQKTREDLVGEEEKGGENEEDEEIVIIHHHDPVEDKIERERVEKIKDQRPIKAPKPKPRTLPSRSH